MPKRKSTHGALPHASAAYDAGFNAGIAWAINEIVRRYTVTPVPTAEKAMVTMLRRSAALDAQKVGEAILGNRRSQRLERKLADENLIPEVCDLVRAGEVNKTIAIKLGIGQEAVKRLRAIAVERGYLGRRERGSK